LGCWNSALLFTLWIKAFSLDWVSFETYKIYRGNELTKAILAGAYEKD
jgi:hypothetical protein